MFKELIKKYKEWKLRRLAKKWADKEYRFIPYKSVKAMIRAAINLHLDVKCEIPDMPVYSESVRVSFFDCFVDLSVEELYKHKKSDFDLAYFIWRKIQTKYKINCGNYNETISIKEK